MDLLSTKIAYAAGVDAFVRKVDALIVNPLIGLLFALALIIFLYGVFEFLWNQTSEEKKTAGKSHMLWGIVGLTIMFGVWTILNMVLNTLEIPKSQINLEEGKVELR